MSLHRGKALEKRKGEHQAWGPWVRQRVAGERAGLQARLETHSARALHSPHMRYGMGQGEGVRYSGTKNGHLDAQPQHPKHRQRGFQARVWRLVWFLAC